MEDASLYLINVSNNQIGDHATLHDHNNRTWLSLKNNHKPRCRRGPDASTWTRRWRCSWTRSEPRATAPPCVTCSRSSRCGWRTPTTARSSSEQTAPRPCVRRVHSSFPSSGILLVSVLSNGWYYCCCRFWSDHLLASPTRLAAYAASAAVDHLARIWEEQATLAYMWRESQLLGVTWVNVSLWRAVDLVSHPRSS